jgi:hypothetical protein
VELTSAKGVWELGVLTERKDRWSCSARSPASMASGGARCCAWGLGVVEVLRSSKLHESMRGGAVNVGQGSVKQKESPAARNFPNRSHLRRRGSGKFPVRAWAISELRSQGASLGLGGAFARLVVVRGAIGRRLHGGAEARCGRAQRDVRGRGSGLRGREVWRTGLRGGGLKEIHKNSEQN